MTASSAFSSLLDNSTSAEPVDQPDEIPLESFPLYNIANYLMDICYPVIISLGVFGNVIAIVIMQRMTSGESGFRYYFIGMAAMDLMFLLSASLKEWLKNAFRYNLEDLNSPFCKIIVWFSTGSATISGWYLVCLTLHRAMSVVWPHRVSVMCTRPTVLGLLLGVGLLLAALYAHYLFGFDVVSSDNGTTYKCLMESEGYMRFIFDVFVYVEIAIYSAVPFAFLALGNTVLVWKLLASVKETRQKLSHGNKEQIVAREKMATSVTLTVVVLSLTFIVLTLPVSVNYILSYFSRQYNQVSGYEYAKAHMFYVVSRLLAESNSAVNFYLYCLTGRKFREEFFRLICQGRTRNVD